MVVNQSAFNFEQPLPTRFDGETFEQTRDGERLSAQLDRVRELMLDGKWRTLAEIAQHVSPKDWKSATPGISARLRDLRKKRFGSYIVEREYVAKGVFKYKVTQQTY